MFNLFGLFKKKTERLPEWSELETDLEPFKRKAWFPITEAKSGSLTTSKFSGVPTLLKGENWPCCGHCQQPMQLFVQLNSSELPEPARLRLKEGLLQAFYCTNSDRCCEVKCEAFFPFAKSTLIRLINPSEDGLQGEAVSPLTAPFAERCIVGWNQIDDYPNWEELEINGIELSDQKSDLLCEMDYPKPNDKLLGWPHWIQGVEYPQCPECDTTMDLLFQIDSEDNLPYMFGDAGCAHITQCPNHPNTLAIAWACC